MNRRNFCMRGFFLLVFVLCTLKSLLVFLTLGPGYDERTHTNLSYGGGSHNMTAGKVVPPYTMETVVSNLQHSEDIFHHLVKTFYKKYNTYYRPRLATALNKSSYVNVIERSGIAPKCTERPFLLIQVHSASMNVKKRLAIRQSWGSSSAHREKTVRTVFVVGRSRLRSVDEIIFSEAREYKDILLTEFFDNYRRLSHKTLHALKWATNHCLPEYMLKTDDDCYVNVPNLLTYLGNNTNSNLYTGRIQWFMPTNRNKSSKFYTSEEDFKELVYPPYASGGGYLFSGGLIPRLVNASARLSIIPNEDSYFGTLMRAINVGPVENNLILPFIYCNESIWDRPSCDFTYPYVIHGVHNYAQIWIHYHVTVLSSVPGLCKQSFKKRHQLNIPLYCYTDFT